MSAATLIARGIGFSPGSVKYIVTAGLLSGTALPSSSSGEHRLAQHRKQKQEYRSIDWSSPMFGEPENPEPKTGEPDRPVVIAESRLPEPQNPLQEVDQEIQLLLKRVIVEEGNIAEIMAIEKSIQEAEQSAIEAERITRLRMSSFALLLLLSAA